MVWWKNVIHSVSDLSNSLKRNVILYKNEIVIGGAVGTILGALDCVTLGPQILKERANRKYQKLIMLESIS